MFPFHFLGFSLFSSHRFEPCHRSDTIVRQQIRKLLSFGDSDEFFGVFVWGWGLDV